MRFLLVLVFLAGCSSSSPAPETFTLSNGNVEMDGDAGYVNPPSGYDHDAAAVNPASIPPDPCMYDSGVDAAACPHDGGPEAG